MKNLSHTLSVITSAAVVIVFALIFFILSPLALKTIEKFVNAWEDELKDRSTSEIILGSIGLIIGLVIAFLISIPIYKIPIPYVGAPISIILYGILAYLGVKIALKNREDLKLKVKDLQLPKVTSSKEKVKTLKIKGIPKILDTSVIIDGRVRDIIRSEFLEGPVVIPVFVLEELQHIADSSDSLKRNRGRRGLDIIKEIQNDKMIEVIIYQGKFDDIKEVDSKLLALTKELGGKIVTNDFNLNKVASVQELKVLNINQLANAVKPVYLPGEEMKVQIVKLGKEHNQGLGYLDDGTMIVVESGQGYLNKTIDVVVTSVLQTAAGKMIFAKPKE